MLFSKSKLSVKDKLDFLEYLSFQLKADASFERTLVRYSENSTRKEHVRELCSLAITDIRNGKNPADALMDNGFIERLEYGIIRNANSNKDLTQALQSILTIIKGNIASNNVLGRSIKSGLVTFLVILLSIPFFKDDIVVLYTSFDQIQGLSQSASTEVAKKTEVPFLIRYWWSSLIVIGFCFLMYQGVRFLMSYLYNNYTEFYYYFFRNRLYQDLISILRTFHQVQKRMSITNAYITLSKNSPNLFWNNLFEDININIKQGGKASEIFVSNKGVLPLEVINCFIDADETGEVELYIEKAIEFCENKNQSINENIKEFGPAIINAILLLIVGLLMVAFLRDIMQKGLVDVMNRI